MENQAVAQEGGVGRNDSLLEATTVLSDIAPLFAPRREDAHISASFRDDHGNNWRYLQGTGAAVAPIG